MAPSGQDVSHQDLRDSFCSGRHQGKQFHPPGVVADENSQVHILIGALGKWSHQVHAKHVPGAVDYSLLEFACQFPVLWFVCLTHLTPLYMFSGILAQFRPVDKVLL